MNPEEMQPQNPVVPEQAPPQPDPQEMLPVVVSHYMDYVVGIKNDKTLDKQVQSQIMLQMAQAINYFVPLLQNDQEAELQMKQAELEMKREEHQMNLEMKQKELEFKQQEHSMKLEHSQAENQMKLQQTQQQNQMALQHQQENHEQGIVQTQQGHEQKMEQGKQAQQLKQGSKQGNN